MDEQHICIVPFNKTNLHHIKGYDGLISPSGDFYKVCERNAMEAVHDYFAEMFVYIKLNQDIIQVYEEFQIIKPQYKNIRLAPKDILINLYGFVNYEYSHHGLVEITPPDANYVNKKINDKQFNMIVDLINLNGDKMESLHNLFGNKYAAYDNEYMSKNKSL